MDIPDYPTLQLPLTDVEPPYNTPESMEVEETDGDKWVEDHTKMEGG